MVETETASQATGNAYSVVVDYGKSVEEMVKSGRYGWSNNNITSKNFPTKRIGTPEVAVELVHFNRQIGTDEAIRKLDRMGYRPAELYELLAFGEKYPEVQREFPVAALGSVWQSLGGRRGVPCLYGSGSERGPVSALGRGRLVRGLSFCRGPQVALWPWDSRTFGSFGSSESPWWVYSPRVFLLSQEVIE